MKFLCNDVIVVEKADVRKILTHRWPCNLIPYASHDRMQTSTMTKLSKFNLLTLGHFRTSKVIPAVVLIEILSQLCALHAHMQFRSILNGKLPQVVSLDGIKITQSIKIGERFSASVEITEFRHPLYAFSGKIINEKGKFVFEAAQIKGYATDPTELHFNHIQQHQTEFSSQPKI